MAFDDIFDKIFNIVKKQNADSPEEMEKAFFNKDGTPREEIFGDVMKDIQNGISGFKKASVPAERGNISDLSDEELYYDVLPEQIFSSDDLNEKQHICLVVYEFEMEFANGGAAQYFANTRGKYVDELAECFKKIGADFYAEKCDDFIKKYNISSKDYAEDESGYDWKKVESMYPYEELENEIMKKYYDDPIQDYVVAFIRANEAYFQN